MLADLCFGPEQERRGGGRDVMTKAIRLTGMKRTKRYVTLYPYP